jgi:hypothetical protein
MDGRTQHDGNVDPVALHEEAGAATVRRSGLVVTARATPVPTRPLPSSATARNRQRVRSSGKVTGTSALPSGPSTTCGAQSAVAAKVARGGSAASALAFFAGAAPGFALGAGEVGARMPGGTSPAGPR